MKNLLFTLAAIFIFLSAKSQDVQAYFQQEVNYKIDVELDDVNHMLNGNLEFEYKNNSNDALPFIYVHLWPNAYKNAKTALAKQKLRNGDRFMFYALEKELGFIDGLDFTVNGQKAAWEYDAVNIDIAKIYLPQVLQPGESFRLTTPFRVKLPSGEISRLGHVGESYQITQWYPKPAVYDRDGWHQMPYLDQGEFYSEFGSYDVSITLPENYVVGATGDLQSAAEIAFLNERVEQTTQGLLAKTNAFPPSSTTMKTIRYTQKDVHDFAWFADKRWHVMKGEVKLPHSGKTVASWAMYTPESADLWQRAIEYINDGTYYYSLWNGDYPYNQVTAIDGTISAGGGMEYPNVTVIGESGNALGLETVIVHEVGHNWFYGILGSNERDNAWMDEGINSFNETRYMQTKYGDSLGFMGGMLSENIVELAGAKELSYRTTDEYAYLITGRGKVDQPIQCHSDAYTDMNYGTIVYKKTAVAFDYLKGYLGEERFDKAMQTYFDQWKFKHPNPNDLRTTLETSTGEDLSWFFDDLIKTTKKVDYAIRSAKVKNGETVLKVKNRGQINGPFEITTYADGKPLEQQWFKGLSPRQTQKIVLKSESDKVKIDGGDQMMDYRRENNMARTTGMFKKVEPLKIRMLTGIENPNYTQVFVTPVVAWNEQNKGMVGLNIHNATLPWKNFEYSFTPLYSFATKNLNGFGRMSFYNGKSSFHLRSSSFNDYYKPFDSMPFPQSTYYQFFSFSQRYLRNSLEYVREFTKTPNSAWKSSIAAELAVISTKATTGFVFSYPLVQFFDVRYLDQKSEEGQLRLRYNAKHSGLVNHFIGVEYKGYYHPRAHYLHFEYKGRSKYLRENNLSWRFYSGIVSRNSVYRLSGVGWLYGNDPGYDYLFLQRGGNNDNLYRQVAGGQGDIHIPILAQSLMSTLRVDADIPKVKIISVFVGCGVYDASIDNVQSNDYFAFSMGISIKLIEDVIALHIPLLSRNYMGASNNEIEDVLNFQFNIAALNPFKLARNQGN
ncbi:MAG: hypothetical protein GC193_14170 [Cryomorphaceae bacterium]|nr:hypothetical protein [Cryomorphaceae bacterium]